MTIWHIWPQLGYAYRLFFIILSLVAIYSIFVDCAVVRRLRSLPKQGPKEDPSVRRSLTALGARMASMRQLVLFVFYLFALLLFLSLPGAGDMVGDGPRTGNMVIWFGMVLHFAFASNVFFVLLVLHLLQWFVSARVNAVRARQRDGS